MDYQHFPYFVRPNQNFTNTNPLLDMNKQKNPLFYNLNMQQQNIEKINKRKIN